MHASVGRGAACRVVASRRRTCHPTRACWS